jgi:hypothetical protein
MRIIGIAIAVTALLVAATQQRAFAARHVSVDPALLMASNDVRLPSEGQVVELADTSMRIFMASVREKSMRGLWDHISLRFREKFSVAQLDEAFKDFYDLQITGDPLAGRSPIFTAGPAIDEHGNLTVDGYYATTPSRVSFHLTFVMEGRTWKLIEINVSAKPVATPAGGTGGTRQSTPAKRL